MGDGLQEAMAQALSGYIKNTTLHAGVHQTIETLHSTNNMSSTATTVMYVSWILIMLIMLFVIGCLSCWVMKKALGYVAIILMAGIGLLLIVDISIHLA